MIGDLFRQVDGDRETNADVAAGLTENRAVNADHFSFGVDQWSAAIARIDRSIGLNEVVVGTGANDAAFGADDAGGDRMLQTERITDRHHPIANVDLTR